MLDLHTTVETGVLGQNFAARELLRLALTEDIGRGDLTTEATVSPEATAVAEIVQKAPGVVCGLPVVAMTFAELDSRVRVIALAEEGSYADERRVVARIEGPARSVLTGERTALNFLQRLSGVATMAHRAAALVEGTGTMVLDTRKTTPGHRILEKYAVRIGGCHNHRAGLDDGILIKENHIRAAGGITAAVAGAKRRTAPMQLVEIEVTNLAELDEAIAAGADVLLVDNADLAGLRAAVARADWHAANGTARPRLEASGGVTLANLAAVARTGVEYVSLGALTHSAGSVDFSLLVIG